MTKFGTHVLCLSDPLIGYEIRRGKRLKDYDDVTHNGVMSERECARLCNDWEDCLSFDHSVEEAK